MTEEDEEKGPVVEIIASFILHGVRELNGS